MSTITGGHAVRVGLATQRQLTRLPFEKVYEDYVSERTFVNADVGLIELDDINSWTSQIYGFGSCGELADLNVMNISTRLVDAPVVASGAASGRMSGRIKGLFYRYKSVGGYDYVAEFLIAPHAPDEHDKAISSRPGDSGAVWHLVSDAPKSAGSTATTSVLKPLAVQWGGQFFADAGGDSGFAFAVATSLTTVCRSLDVELVTAHNTGVRPYWGSSGHYTIGAFACGLVKDASLKTLMGKNASRVAYVGDDLSAKAITDGLREARDNSGFVPLADVPDMVWKKFHTEPGGRDTQSVKGRTNGPEHPTHYADIDEARPSDKKTLRELSLEDDANLSVKFWHEFYDETGHTASRERGCLPFRVWQFFNEMRDAADRGDVERYVCAAGLLAHYVGDACQPLHGSVLADGYKDRPKTVTHTKKATGEEYETDSNVGAGVHSLYESKMIDRYMPEILSGIPDAVPATALRPIVSGWDAAKATVELMDRAAKRIPPKALVDAYVKAGDKPSAAARDALWKKFGDDTIAVLADGARVLAAIWDAAWDQGNGGNIDSGKLKAIATDRLQALYEDPEFVPSLDLDSIANTLGGHEGTQAAAKKPAAQHAGSHGTN